MASPIDAAGFPDAGTIEIVVRDPSRGVVLARMSLQIQAMRGPMACMQPLTAGTPVVGKDAPLHGDVAGRIAADGTTLAARVDAWLKHLCARGRKPRSVAAFRQVVSRAIRDLGWATSSDITYASVTGYFAAQAWAGATRNRNASVFRSLTAFLARSGDLQTNPLEDLERAVDAKADGARAATVEEARAIILHAWIRDRADGRSRVNRALYWLCLFAAGCRVSEPALWRRRHLCLDAVNPYIDWTPDIHKSGKRRECALAPELAEQLRLHLTAQDLLRAERGLPRAGPDEPVFERVPTRTTFRADRDAAGIAAEDRRGRAFSPHSARKFLATQLHGEEKMVDYLMRHVGRVEHRYFDPPLADQAAAISRLPRLWPHTDPPSCGRNVDNSDSGDSDLTPGGEGVEDVPGTQGSQRSSTRSRPAPPPAPECQRRSGDYGRERDAERVGRTAGQGRREATDRSSGRPHYEVGNRHFRTRNWD